MKSIIVFFAVTLAGSLCCSSAQQRPLVAVTPSNSTDFTLNSIIIEGDSLATNWIMRSDSSQYKWLDGKYAWGGVNLTCSSEDQSNPYYFTRDSRQGDVEVKLVREVTKIGTITETYVLTNRSQHSIEIRDIGINTPFNDNYPSAKECMAGRANAHVWAGGSSSYVCATHMSGRVPGLGLLVRQGALSGYEIKGRSMSNNMSNVRGVIVLNVADVTLKPGQSYTLTWELFAHKGWDDFFEQIKSRGAVRGSAERYVVERGQAASVSFTSNHSLSGARVTLNGQAVKYSKRGKDIVVDHAMSELGEARFVLDYDGGRSERVDVLVISSADSLLARRADFIINRQQYLNSSDKRYGAYMVYDNERDEIFLNDRKTVSYYDRDEGAERMGMAIFLAMQYQHTRDAKTLESLDKYMKFVREQLQTQDYTTYSTYRHEGRNRAYNYPWVAHLNVEMYKATGRKQYLEDCYGTMKALYRNFGHGFYAFGIPVRESIEFMRAAGMNAQAESLLADYVKAGDIYIANGTNYPPHEVNFEQTIVSPLIMLLTQLYQLTGKQKYLDQVKLHMPLLESFSGFQPSYHLNEIGIRHWDGYWFGKSETWGDTFPHYWSTLTGICYSLYGQCIGDQSYECRAENIVRNNLCQFFEDGRASCAYIYPDKVNGVKARFYDAFANDQDFALVYYLMVMQQGAGGEKKITE